MQERYKILYVEDEVETRKNIVNYIKQYYSTQIIEASDGLEGWEAYQENKPDILITDISMDKLCGLSLIEKIRKVDNKIKIIVITAHAEQDRLLRAVKLNLVEYYIKPIARKVLKKVLTNTIEQLNTEEKNQIAYFNENSYYNITEEVLYIDNSVIKLTQYETKLLNILLENKNKVLESHVIFNELWDFDKEYKADSVRTLIKKLRKKLPDYAIENCYGGLYRLSI